MKLYVVFFLLFSIMITQLCFAQKENELINDFIKVYKKQLYLVPPFPTDIVEISNCRICFRTELPPRQNMEKEFLDLYDSTDQNPHCCQIDTTEFDLIVKFIMTSGLLDIDMNYTKPKSFDGVVISIAGGPNIRYIIETGSFKLDLLIAGGEYFELPLLLKQFDEMFRKIEEKYKAKESTVKP